jgi:hypothetical protein
MSDTNLNRRDKDIYLGQVGIARLAISAIAGRVKSLGILSAAELLYGCLEDLRETEAILAAPDGFPHKIREARREKATPHNRIAGRFVLGKRKQP